MNFNIEKICNIGGCVLIFVLLALLIIKPQGIMSILEGQNANNSAPNNSQKNRNNVVNNNNNRVNNNAAPAANTARKNSANNVRNNAANNNGKQGVMASLPLGDNEQFASVSGFKTPTRSCYPQNSLKPDDLLPSDDQKNINDFNKDYPISEGILKGVNFLEAGHQVGVNTVGQSLRNANQQLRSEPPNPQVNVSPWQNTTIGPDLGRRPIEVGEDCYAASNTV